MASRYQRYFLDGVTPRYVRCYDNGGKTLDRYTVVFTGRYRHKTCGEFWDLTMNSQPFHGIGQHGFSETLIDRPSHGHLGKRIAFADLPYDCRKLVVLDYCYLNDVTPTDALAELYPGVRTSLLERQVAR